MEIVVWRSIFMVKNFKEHRNSKFKLFNVWLGIKQYFMLFAGLFSWVCLVIPFWNAFKHIPETELPNTEHLF
jgi:hypothetical protein